MTKSFDAGTIARLGNEALMASPYPDPRFPPSPYYRFLKLLALEMEARLSVELGVSGGGGSLHLAMGSKIAVGVDYAWDHEENINHIMNNYPDFNFMRGDSINLAPFIFEQFGLIDILFIDTTHTLAQTTMEYQAYKPFMSPNSVICLDDLFRPGMKEAWDMMPEPKLRLDTLHLSQAGEGGFGVIF